MTAPPDGGKRPPNLTKSVIIFAVLVATSYILGFIGLYQHLEHKAGILSLLYYDLQLFVLGADPLQEKPDGLPTALQIARFVAPTVAIFAVFETGRVLVFAEYHRRRTRHATGHAVVCGDSPSPAHSSPSYAPTAVRSSWWPSGSSARRSRGSGT
ncbi:hypothetical protein ACFQX7_28420 [Luedemannella flava]